jgi:VanZ family protein
MNPTSRGFFSQQRLCSISRVILLGYWLVLFLATHTPRPPKLPNVSNIDKWMHLGAYAVLAYLLSLHLATRAKRVSHAWAKVLLGLAVYALLDELLQIPVGRHCEFWDWVADLTGIVLGVGAWKLTARRLNRQGREGRP